MMLGTVSAGWFDFLGANSNAQGNDENTFVVGFDAEFPPYGYKDDNGSYTGFDLELAEEVCHRNNWTFKAQPINWDAKDAELDSGSIDCIWNGFTIDGRENDYLWSEPYFDNKQVFVVKTSSNINSMDDLSGKTVYLKSLHDVGKWEITTDIEMATKCADRETANIMLNIYYQEIGNDNAWVIVPLIIQYQLIDES